MKLWLLDADIIIDLLGLDIFHKLIKIHAIYVSSTVIGEVKFFMKGKEKVGIDFRRQYVDSDLVKELSASIEEIKEVLSKLPFFQQEAIDPGELESLAILVREDKMKFCSCDAATIRALPFLDVSERGISAEKLLKLSGLSRKRGLSIRHTEQYFRSNLKIGQNQKISSFKTRQ